jgi:methylated-DNA-protein-cysteine methyltransferase-like protein
VSQFNDAVAKMLDGLEPGEVVTYGEVAMEAGFPGAARAVGTFLARHDGYPWWRVVNATGRLAPGKEQEQTRRLRAENVTLASGRVKLARRTRFTAHRSSHQPPP